MRLATQVAYWVYSAGRSLLRRLGLIRVARRRLGRVTALVVYLLSGNARHAIVVGGHQMFLAPPGDYPSLDLVLDRYEVGTTRLMHQLIQRGQTVVDIGAHAGYYTLMSAQLVGPTGRVYAFEPAPKNYDLLMKNIAMNGYTNIVPVPQAITDHEGSVNLFLSRFDNGFHSLFQIRPASPADEKPIQIHATTLDAFMEQEGWPSVAVMKLDIEGGELAALKGMQRFLERTRDLWLVMEFCPWILRRVGTEPIEFLASIREQGFRLYMIASDGLVPFEQVDGSGLIDRLLRNEGYTNLLCVKGSLSVLSGSERAEPGLALASA